MNTFTVFKRGLKKKRKSDIKFIAPSISRLKTLGYKSSGWFDFPTAGKSRHWKKVGGYCFLEIRDIDGAKLIEIPEVCLSVD